MVYMNKTEAIACIQQHLPEKRFQHTIRVMDTALELAKTYHIAAENMELAAIFHDYAKYRNLDEMKRIIINSTLPKDLLHYHTELWHGPVGAILIQQEYGIDHPDILRAIRYHTTGRAHMSLFEMILFVADYIEPGREIPGVEEVREMAKENITLAAQEISKRTIHYLLSQNQSVYPDSFFAYNDLTRKINGGL